MKILAKSLLKEGLAEVFVDIFADSSHDEYDSLRKALDLIASVAPDWGDALCDEIMQKARTLRADNQGCATAKEKVLYLRTVMTLQTRKRRTMTWMTKLEHALSEKNR